MAEHENQSGRPGRVPGPGIIRNFAPSWHAAVMGTGALAIGLYSYQTYFAALAVVGTIFFYITIGLFVVLFVPWLLRWVLFFRNAMADLRHPMLSNFYPTLSAGIVVLGMDFTIVGGRPGVGVILWLIGSIITVIFSLVTPYMMFVGNHIKLDHINPGFFIPPVALLVIPLGGAMLLPHVNATMVSAVALFNFFGFGTGFFLYLAFLAVTLYRFILHDPLPEALAATVWINIGPLGAGALALVNIAKFTPFITAREPYFVSALFLWGFGAWWVLMAAVMSIHYLGHRRFPYGLSWWGFTFPTGAFVLASHAIAGALHLPLVDHIGFGVLWLLAALWLLTFVKTIQRSADGSLFADKSQPAPRPAPVK